MNLISSECVILKRQDFQDSDVLVTFLARDRGRMKGIVRGSKKITGRGVGSFEPFTLGVMHYTEKPSSDLVSIRKCDPHPPYLYLQQDYRKLMLAAYLADLIQLGTVPADDAGNFHALLAGALERLCAAEDGATLALLRLGFELDYLQAHGWQFLWHACVGCGARIYHRSGPKAPLRLVRPEPHQGDVTAGGVRCPDCRVRGEGALELSPGTLAFLAAWRAGEGESVRPTRLALRELEAVLTRHLERQMERRPRSLALLPPVEDWLGSAP
jgi:DNA repair protein RecO (recombination protein O)